MYAHWSSASEHLVNREFAHDRRTRVGISNDYTMQYWLINLHSHDCILIFYAISVTAAPIQRCVYFSINTNEIVVYFTNFLKKKKHT